MAMPPLLLPLMMPARSPVAAEIVSTLSPNVVAPLPDKDLTLVPELERALMSKLPLLLTPLELAMLPLADKAKVPALIVVRPL